MTTPSEVPHRPTTPTCGCCGRPRTHMAELGSTPGVYICSRCALWAARRALNNRLGRRLR
ncbi:MAG: hypothetical protein KJ747_05285 [Actinobacteria bacterium]|nr:hypothetical protein [Actinomycetota bacterium]